MLQPAINSTVGRLFACLSGFQNLTLQFPLFLKCCLRECVCSQEPVFSSTGKEGHGVRDKRNMICCSVKVRCFKRLSRLMSFALNLFWKHRVGYCSNEHSFSLSTEI